MTKQQYTDLGKMVQELTDKPVKVLLFPCNQFLSQEPKMPTKESLKKMSTQQLLDESDKHVILMEKVEVNGSKASPVFEFLKYNSSLYQEAKHLVTPIPWNFSKFLVDQKGHVFKYYAPTVKMADVQSDIQGLLSESDSHKAMPSRAPTKTLD
mmetsp:Transcript_136248/g.236903  ORF Transcript_136248/g.236903 Transcript_136248/m.236903 type:complete len:153 (+) Transcript_136248:248-706(+)